MFGIIRNLFGRGDAEDERVLAYLEDRASEADSRRLEDSEDLDSLRETVRMLRDVAEVEAPRSFAVNEENLFRQGYGRDEIERILNPSSSGIRIGIGSIPAYVPLILASIAVLGVVLLTVGDITDFEMEDQVISGPSAPGLPGEPGQPGAPAKAAPAATARPGIAAVGGEKEEIIVQTVVVERVVEVERQVIQTVEVERVVEREVVHTVEVEREVMSEVVVETVVVMEAVAADAPDEAIDSMDVSPTETSTPSPVPSPTFTAVPTPTSIPTEPPIPTAIPEIDAFTSPSDVTVSEGSGRAAFGLQMWIIQVALILIAVLLLLVWAWMRLRR